MVLEFILLLKNNNFKYIQRWKQTNLLHFCVNRYEDWWPRWASQGNEIPQHTALGDPTLQSWSCSAWIPAFCKESLGREGNQTNSAWTISRPREPPAVCNPEANSWWIQRFFFLFLLAKQHRKLSQCNTATLTAEISASTQSCCLTPTNAAGSEEIWPQLDPLKACKCWSSLMNQIWASQHGKFKATF